MTNKKRGIVMLTLDEIIEAEIQRQDSEEVLGSFSDTELVNGSSSNDD